MNTKATSTLILTLLCLITVTDGFSQYVRREYFPNEESRRNYYGLDDWISYLPSNRLSSAAIGDNYIYFSTLAGGILRYNLNEDFWDYPYTTSNGLPSNTVFKIAFDPERAFLWAQTARGDAYFDPASEIWVPGTNSQFRWPTVVPPNSTQKFQKNVFYSRQALSGLPVFFANGEFTITGEWMVIDRYFREYPIIGFIIDRQDRIWFLVDGFGIGEGDMFSQRADFYRVGLPDISPRAIQFHRDDLWIGGLRLSQQAAGIVRWRNDNGRWEYFEEGWTTRLLNDNVHAIAVDGDSLWFGTEYGVSLYNTRKNSWKNFSVVQGLISNYVLDLAVFNNYLYVGTDHGMSRIDRSTGKIRRIQDTRLYALSINRLAVQKDTLWAATNRGIYRYPASRKRWEFIVSQAVLRDSVITAVTNYKNEMWFATSSGVMWLNLKTNQWEDFPEIALEIRGPYMDIKANEKSVWVATMDGIMKFDKKRRYWRLFTENDGLSSNKTYQILLDGPYLWVATEAGITQFYWDNPARID